MATGSPMRSRAQKKLLRVTFEDGTVFCYSSATVTYIEALKKIGPEKLKDIGLEIGHLPIISRECYPKYKDYMKPLGDGWYVNTQSDSSQKYIQLMSIRNALRLDMVVEIGTDLEPSSVSERKSRVKTADHIVVKFPDGELVGGPTPRDAYVSSLMKLGLEMLRQKGIEAMGKECVTRFNKYPGQIEVHKGLWVTIPNQTKDKVKALDTIASKLHIQLEVSAS